MFAVSNEETCKHISQVKGAFNNKVICGILGHVSDYVDTKLKRMIDSTIVKEVFEVGVEK